MSDPEILRRVFRAISAYNFVVGIVLFGILRIAGRLRKDKVIETRTAPFVIPILTGN